MPCDVTLLPDLPVVLFTLAGEVSPTELQRGAQETLALLQQHRRSLVLADSRLLTGGHNVADLFRTASECAPIAISGNIREAVLVPTLPKTADQASFWETTCLNRGVQVKLFTDRAAALAWLLAGSSDALPSPPATAI